MNFLHLIPNAHNGGTEKDCYHIIKADLGNRHQVWVFGKPGPMSNQWEKAGAIVDHFDILQYNLFVFNRVLHRSAQNNNWDGIYYWSSIRLPMVRAALKNQSCRLAVHIGNPIQKNIKIDLKNKFLDWFYPSKITTHLFPCSRFVQQSLKNATYYSGFPSTVSLNPVRLLGQNPHVPKPLDHNSAIHIGMVARLDPIKDHKTAIMGFKKVSGKFPNAILHLLGEGVLREKLENLVQELGIKDKVKFHGNVSNVYEHLNSWDLFVYSTTPQEGLGNVVSEALANGLPCVLSDLPMLREITGDRDCALYFPWGDHDELAFQIEKLILDIRLRKSYSINGYERALSAFSSERYLKDRLKFLLNKSE